LKAALLGSVIAAFGAATPAIAVDPSTAGVWEIDGNTPDNGIHDWNDLYPTTPQDLLGASATTGIAVDTVNNLFSQGSKDTQDVSKWAYTVQSAPPKADIRAAYAIRYKVGDDDVIYFGSDRGTTTGTTFSGYWFFQDDVKVDPNSNKFIGQHKVGDVLVAAAYDNGGHVGSIVIYQWQGGNGTAGHLQFITSATNPISTSGKYCDLADSSSVNTTCGQTNSSSLNGTIPWRSNDSLPPGVFFEGGIDFTALFKGNVPCFASFLATTRSSTSTNAEIKNFVVHGFGACNFNVSKTCLKPDNTPNCVLNAATGKNICTITGQVNNTGGAPLSVTLTDVITTASTTATDNNDLSYVDCSTNTPTGSATATVAANSIACYQGTFTTDDSGTPFSDKITGTPNNVSGLDAKTATATCSPQVGDSHLINTKGCTAALVAENNVLDVLVTVTGTLKNQGNIDVHNVTVSDNMPDPAHPTLLTITPVLCDANGNPTNVPTGDPSGTSIYMKANSCAIYSGSYRPSSLGSGSCAAFSDTTSASGIDPFGVPVGQTLTSTPTATCSLCPLNGTGTCPAP
jgi:hypothetical protein